MQSLELLTLAGFKISEPRRYGQAFKYPPATQVVDISLDNFTLKDIRVSDLETKQVVIVRYLFRRLSEQTARAEMYLKQIQSERQEHSRIMDLIDKIRPCHDDCNDDY